MNDADLGRMLRAGATRFEAPTRLSRAIGSALRDSERPAIDRSVARRARAWLPWARIATAFAAGLAVAWLSTSLLWTRDASDRLTDEAVADHVRALMANHLADVASSDQHTVKPWFDGRLIYSPPVPDLATVAFPLAGGRLDYLDGRTVAALVYRHRLHVINVFVWPDAKACTPTASAKDGYNVVGWCDNGMRFLSVSDLNGEELSRFVQLFRQQG